MLVEKIIFTILSIYFLIAIFLKFIKRIDKLYACILLTQFFSLILGFIQLIFILNFNIFIKIIMYIISIFIPAIILMIEHKGKNLSELILTLLAKFYKLTGNTKKVKEIWILISDKYPKNYLCHKKLAEIYKKEGGMRKAIDEYVKAVDLDKKDYDSYYEISFLLNELGKKDDAVVMLNNLLSKKPDYINASMLLGDILCAKELYKDAINVYTNGLKYSPNNYDLYYNMGIVYTMLNDFQNAKICYEKAATINSLLYNAFYSLGQINLIEMDLDEAEKYFNKCLESKEHEPDAYYKLGKIYMLRGDFDNAVKYVNLAIELDNNYIKIANQEPIFIPVKSKFEMPIIDEEDIQERKKPYTKKEKKAIEHLDNTYKVVGKLNMHKLKPNMKRQKENYKDIEREF